jgi:hypothetical protein
MGLRVLAPSGSGKSTAAEAYIDRHSAGGEDEPMKWPVVKVDLEKYMTPRKFMMLILDRFKDRYATSGDELNLKRRVLAYFERLGTELLIVDEIQHLNYRNGAKNDVTDTLKRLLDGGVVPIVFLGTKEAEGMFKRNLQFNSRLIAPCDMPPLNSLDRRDRELFSGFVARLERVVVDCGALPERSNFGEAGLLPGLFEVSAGVVGRVSRLFEIALEAAITRGAARLAASDIAFAVDTWAIPQGFAVRNPFWGLTDV